MNFILEIETKFASHIPKKKKKIGFDFSRRFKSQFSISTEFIADSKYAVNHFHGKYHPTCQGAKSKIKHFQGSVTCIPVTLQLKSLPN